MIVEEINFDGVKEKVKVVTFELDLEAGVKTVIIKLDNPSFLIA
jgi:hypothetical protein